MFHKDTVGSRSDTPNTIIVDSDIMVKLLTLFVIVYPSSNPVNVL